VLVCHPTPAHSSRTHCEAGNGGGPSTSKGRGLQAQEDSAEYQLLRSQAERENRLEAWEEEIVAKEFAATLKAEREAVGGTDAARKKAAKILQQQLDRIVS